MGGEQVSRQLLAEGSGVGRQRKAGRQGGCEALTEQAKPRMTRLFERRRRWTLSTRGSDQECDSYDRQESYHSQGSVSYNSSGRVWGQIYPRTTPLLNSCPAGMLASSHCSIHMLRPRT